MWTDKYPTANTNPPPDCVVPLHMTTPARAPAQSSTSYPAKNNEPYILSYTWNLSGVTGIITDELTLPRKSHDSLTIIGKAVVAYLTAHGYTTEAQYTIASAYMRFSGVEAAFTTYLCGKGMAKLEATWLWDYIIDSSWL